MATKELVQDRLRNLLREEQRSPYTRLDQINTVIQTEILGIEDLDNPNTTELLTILRRLLTADPSMVSPLNRAAMEHDGGDWIEVFDQEHLSPPEDDGLSELLEFINKAEDASLNRLLALDTPEDAIVHFIRLSSKPPVNGRRAGYLAVDFLVEGSPLSCYDRTVFLTDDYVDLLLRLIVNGPALEIVHKDDRSKPIHQGPMFAYHPERMRASRSYLKRLPAFGTHGGKPACTHTQLNAMATAVQKEMAEHHLDDPVAEKERNGGVGLTPIFREHDLAATWLAYIGTGREIFDIPARLTDLFTLSDCDDLQLTQVHTPYKAQYIHFGQRPELELAPGWYCDGAYVLNDAGAMTIRFTAAPPTADALDRWRMRPEPVLKLAFEPEDQPLDIGTAVDTAVARHLEELRQEGAGAAQRQAEADAAIAEMGLEGRSRVKVVTAERVKSESDELLASREVAHKALSLLVNALCYLTAYQDDVEYRWPETAPKGLVEQLKGGTPGRRKRAEQQLHAEGFSKIRLCGRKFRAMVQPEHQEVGTVRSHWRRGHFRGQAFGQGRQLRKIIWIMPVLVNATTMTEDTELPGHLYLVESQPEDRHLPPVESSQP